MENQHELNVGVTPEPNPADPLRIEPSVLVSYEALVNRTIVKTKPLSEVIEEIRSSPGLKAKIEIVREEKDKVKRKLLKATTLPYLTFSHFRDHKRDNQHFKFTKFMLIDIDGVADRLEELRERFKADSRIFLFFVSPSGDGIKVVFALNEYIDDVATYEKVYRYLQNKMRIWYGVEPDTSTVSPQIPCFLSSDSEIHVRWNPARFDVPNAAELELEKVQVAKKPNAKENEDIEILELMKGVSSGGRHRAVTRLAAFYKNKRMDYAATLETLRGTNKANTPPFTEEELVKTIEYVFKKENYGNRDRDKDKAIPVEVSYDEVAHLQNEPIIYTPNLVTGWMKTVGMNLLSGTEGSGKSILALNLCLCVCRGEEFLGRTVRQGKVLYLDNELDKEEFKDRLQHMNKPVPADTFHILFDAPVIEAKYVEEKIAEFKPSLVVIDSFYLATNAKEKDNDALKEILGLLKGLVHKYQCVVLVITHFHKGTKYDKLHMDMTVGGGAQNRIVNGAFLMRRSDKDESKRIIKADKLRGFDDDERKPRLLSFDKATFTFHDEGLVDEEHHIAHLGEKKMEKIDVLGLFKSSGKTSMSRDEIIVASEDLGYSIPTVDRAIKRGMVKDTLWKEKRGTYTVVQPVTTPTPVADNNDKSAVEEERER